MVKLICSLVRKAKMHITYYELLHTYGGCNSLLKYFEYIKRYIHIRLLMFRLFE